MTDPIPAISVTEAAQRLEAADPATAPLLVDVRERNEFDVMRVPGAVLMPLSGFTLKFEDLPRERALLLMCAVGGRSGRATQFLLANGFRDVHNVAGGITAWNAAGLPVRTGTPQAGEGALPEPD